MEQNKDVAFITCPLCGARAPHEEHVTDALTKRTSHIWVCSACPFIAFEYWNNGDARLVADVIENRE